MNPFASHIEKTHPNDKRSKKQKLVESFWESYKTLALLEVSPDANTALQSPAAQAANIIELARLRRLFWDVPESLTIDPARPTEMPSEA